MIVYKSYLKIIKTMLPTFFMFVGIFLVISILNYKYAGNTGSATAFASEKMDISVVDRDQSQLSQSLTRYLGQENNLVEVKDDFYTQKDALFYRETEYIITIPEHFQEDFLAGKEAKVERMEIPGSYSGYYVDNLIDKYLNLSHIYITGDPKIKVQTLTADVESNLKDTTKVTLTGKDVSVYDKDSIYSRIANFAAYVIFGVLIVLIGMAMLAFQEEKIQIRTMVSSTPPGKIALAQIACNGILTLAVVLVEFLLLVAIDPSRGLSVKGVIMLVNMLCLGIVALSISFLTARLIRSRAGQSAAANVIALGCAFLCGVFVPTSFLGEGVQQVARFLPVTYYVEANTKLFSMETLNFSGLKPIFLDLGIQLIFAAVFFGLSVAAVKVRRGKR